MDEIRARPHVDAATESDVSGGASADTHATDSDQGLEELLAFIRDARGFDFTGYKRASLARRIRKRMHDVKVADWSDYRDRLEIDAEEFRLLFNTILINVTGFFRDVEAWNALQTEVLPQVLARSGSDEELRIWSAGCSSGEEAYSLVIAVAEAIGIEETLDRVKVYGTDVDDEALREARAGVYPAKRLEGLPVPMRERYFEANGGGYSFRTDLRRRVIFGRHDLTRDAPISRLDLLVCRNTLMYFNVEAQAQVVDRFHFALKEEGFLFLGKAEMLLSDMDRFEVVNVRQRLFRRKAGRPTTSGHPIQLRLEAESGAEPPAATRNRVVGELMVENSPVAVIGLDAEGRLVTASAHARAQFGITTHDVGRQFRDHELSYRPVELRPLIDQAHRERRSIRLTSVERRSSVSDSEFFDIVVQPLWNADADPAAIGTSVTFIDTTVQTRLQHDLKQIREDLETAYEELQSTNEELETTNEEMQSGNEELETMNEEMQVRTRELDGARAFLEGVLASVAAAVVVLGHQNRVQAWNSSAEDMWGLRAAEVQDEPFFSLEFGLPVTQLRDLVERCVRERRRTGPVEVPAVNRRGRSLRCRVICSPLDGVTDGVVLLMEEVVGD